MSIDYYEMVTVSSEFVTADLIIWKRYRVRAAGMTEALLDVNPHLAPLHRFSPFLPVGTQVRVPIDPVLIAGAPKPKVTIQLWGAG